MPSIQELEQIIFDKREEHHPHEPPGGRSRTPAREDRRMHARITHIDSDTWHAISVLRFRLARVWRCGQ